MIYIKIKDLEFYDDTVALIKSFYPRTEVSLQKEGNSVSLGESDHIIELETPDKENKTKREFHEAFKLYLYKKLCEETGKSLPWGNLTGVRPSKIVVNMLEEGFSEEEIAHHFSTNHFVSREKINLAVEVAKKELTLLHNIDYRKGYSLYIGIPFCPTTCLYCSFTSYSLAMWEKETDHYLDALVKELEFIADSMSGKRLDTVYFGGGTPTTLTAQQLDRLLTVLEDHFDMENVYELTVEAGRPDSITIEKLQVLRNHGVSRISINPQTMNQETLDIIGRKHSVEQVTEAFLMAREAGFDNINMDLIIGLPGEDRDKIEKTLRCVKELSPDSLTVHSLAIKRAAAINMWKEKYKALEITNSDEIVEMTAEYAAGMGLEPYYMYRQKNMAGNFENVGYSISGKECIYNILIMEEKQTIIAAGAGASTKVVFNGEADADHPVRIERIENVKDVRNYIDRIDEMIDRKRKFFTEYKF